MTDLIVDEYEGSFSCRFYCGDLPADAAVAAAGHEPNGYFWEGLVQYLAPELVEQLQLDSEAGMFAAYGDRGGIERLKALLQPYLVDGSRVASVIEKAEAAGFEFDD